jgi:hypothetical protein
MSVQTLRVEIGRVSTSREKDTRAGQKSIAAFRHCSPILAQRSTELMHTHACLEFFVVLILNPFAVRDGGKEVQDCAIRRRTYGSVSVPQGGRRSWYTSPFDAQSRRMVKLSWRWETASHWDTWMQSKEQGAKPGYPEYISACELQCASWTTKMTAKICSLTLLGHDAHFV